MYNYDIQVKGRIFYMVIKIEISLSILLRECLKNWHAVWLWHIGT